MSAFLYYLEGWKQPLTRREQLAELGVEYAFEAAEKLPYNAQREGPGAGKGTMLCDDARLAPYEPVYLPDVQTWRRVPDRFRPGLPPLWIGYFNAAPLPSPADLVRRETLDGPLVRLADDREWLVPVVKVVDLDGEIATPLPSYLELDDEGRTRRGEVIEKHRWLLERVQPFWDAWLPAWQATRPEDKTFTISLPDSIFEDAAAVLSANYRVGPIECSLMKLFRSDFGLAEILKAACDCERAMLFLQKKSP